MSQFVASDRSLSHIAKMLPPEAMALWCDHANEAADAGADRNACVMAAWKRLQDEGWRRSGKKYIKGGDSSDGDHVRIIIAKDEPTAADVHIDVPLGSDRKKKKKPQPADYGNVSGYTGADIQSDSGSQIRSVPTNKNFEIATEVRKIDEGLGIVFGWAVICKRDGEDYFDLQGDHIPEDSMLAAAADFMQSSRISGDMHARDADGNPVADGTAVFMWPLTSELAKAMGMEAGTTGLMIGIKPSPDVLAKFKDGTYKGFSIGGLRGQDEELTDDGNAYDAA